MSLPSQNSSWAAVYAGDTCVGHLFARHRLGYEAFDLDDKSLGVFPSPPSAVLAIVGSVRPTNG